MFFNLDGTNALLIELQHAFNVVGVTTRNLIHHALNDYESFISTTVLFYTSIFKSKGAH